MTTITAGFARADLAPCIHDGTGFRRPLEATAAWIEGDGALVALVALDLIELPPLFCEQVCRAAAVRLGIQPESILLHTTHTHTAPWDRELGSGVALDGLDRIVAQVVAKARTAAQPAAIRVGQRDVGSRLSVYRRGDAGPELGCQTFWFGYQYRDGDPRADASALANDMRSRWLGKGADYRPGLEPIWFDHAVDGLVQAMSFESASGQTLGTLVRFAAHPHLASACRNRLYDPDYPVAACDTVRQKLGGECLFLLGPAADLVPREHVTYEVDQAHVRGPGYFGPSSALVAQSDAHVLAEMNRIGRELGEAALDALSDAAPEQLTALAAICRPFAAPLGPLLPPSRSEINRMRRPLLDEYQSYLRRGGSVRELRLLANRMNWLEWAATKSLNLLSDQERAAGAKEMPVWAVRINQTRMAFMHSEIAMETSERLRTDTADPGLWTISLTGGSLEYLPTAEMIDEGGYEGRSTVVSRDAEEKLRAQLGTMLREIGA